MENLAFVEFNSVRKKESMNKSFTNYNMMSLDHFNNCNMMSLDHFNLVLAPKDEYELKPKDVTKKLYQGTYCFEMKYTIIFLYDYFEDQLARDFLTMHGAWLHNYSASNISILTFFSKITVDKWTNVSNRGFLSYPEEYDPKNVSDLVFQIQSQYKVQSKLFPALIVIKTEDEGEEHFVVSLNHCKKIEDIRKAFRKAMDTITNNCEENFSVIKDELCGTDYTKDRSSKMDDINLQRYINNLVDNEKLKVKNYKNADLADELRIDERTLRNKKSGRTKFTRDECIYIGIRFSLGINATNKLLLKNKCDPLSIGGRDGAIRNALACEYNCKKTNDYLKECNFEPLPYSGPINESFDE